jgi:hypothetical protein
MGVCGFVGCVEGTNVGYGFNGGMVFEEGGEGGFVFETGWGRLVLINGEKGDWGVGGGDVEGSGRG